MLESRRRGRGGFALMEVVVSLVILGIAMAALMHSFTISMSAIRKNESTTQACVLAETLMQSIEAQPPENELTNGDFSSEGEKFAKYSWELRYTDEELEYRHRKSRQETRDLRKLRHVTLAIRYFDEKKMQQPELVVELQSYVPPIEKFSQRAKFENELFLEDEAGGGRRR